VGSASAQDHRDLPLPRIDWADVERYLESQGYDPKEVVARAAASLDAWSALSPDERRALYVYPDLEAEF
jgi:DNA primase